MKKYFICFVLFTASFIYAQKHFITDNSYLAKVEKKFAERKELAKERDGKLFGVLNSGISLEESEALKFLYSYMPLCDLADYNGDFFLKQVQYSLKARETFKWGKEIPEMIFRHFVLPYRVNNENLDTARIVFFNELKDRVKNLSLKEAALEVNYWCLEKVTYRGTDIRTSAPLSAVRTAYGRCGEESTFTVTALRSVGIPARQVYTPRWAHSDDNHAWVEVWVDGKWHYMGACEPDPDLDMGWFTGPATRAMLIHTKVFGDYPGNDEVVNKTEDYTEINVLPNYADTKKIYVKVIDKSGRPVEGARVDFGLYNYAEFYPIASKTTDKKGITFLTTGFGTLVIWTSKENLYAYEKITVASTDTLVLKPVKYSASQKELVYDLIPPELKTVTKKTVDRQENDRKTKKANAIREKYRSTFIDTLSILKFAGEMNLDKNLVLKYMKLSEGNWREIKTFLQSHSAENKDYLFGLLGQVSEKDLRDTRASILDNHFMLAVELQEKEKMDNEIFINYILNPRIKNENLLAYRSILRDRFKNLINGDKKQTALNIAEWIKKNIKINERENYYNLPVTPIGVYELKRGNKESRNIFFVAVCRSLGIPAQLEPKLKTPQYLNNGEWVNVYFEDGKQVQPEYGFLLFKNGNPGSKIDPKYYTHFTIGKLENGAYKTIDYETEPVLSSFKEPVKLETGHYRLITGNRRSDGAAFSSVSFFDIKKGKTAEAVIKLRDTEKNAKILGKIDLKSQVEFENREAELAKFFGKDKIIIGWVEPAKEPTRHVIVELHDLNKKFEEWGGSILFIVTKENETTQFIKDNAKGLPGNISFIREKAGVLYKNIRKELGLKEETNFPLFVVINKKGEIVFSTEGYKIGTGELLLKNVVN